MSEEQEVTELVAHAEAYRKQLGRILTVRDLEALTDNWDLMAYAGPILIEKKILKVSPDEAQEMLHVILNGEWNEDGLMALARQSDAAEAELEEFCDEIDEAMDEQRRRLDQLLGNDPRNSEDPDESDGPNDLEDLDQTGFDLGDPAN